MGTVVESSTSFTISTVPGAKYRCILVFPSIKYFTVFTIYLPAVCKTYAWMSFSFFIRSVNTLVPVYNKDENASYAVCRNLSQWRWREYFMHVLPLTIFRFYHYNNNNFYAHVSDIFRIDFCVCIHKNGNQE